MKVPLYDRSGRVVDYTLVDEKDAPLVLPHRWTLQRGRKPGYPSYARAFIDGASVLLHRYLLGLTDPKVETDHENRNGLDNRRANLRVTDRSGNCQNRESFRASSSRHRGVSWHKRSRKWQAYARQAGVLHHLGSYDSEDEAGAAAAAWRSEHMPYSSDNIDRT